MPPNPCRLSGPLGWLLPVSGWFLSYESPALPAPRVTGPPSLVALPASADGTFFAAGRRCPSGPNPC